MSASLYVFFTHVRHYWHIFSVLLLFDHLILTYCFPPGFSLPLSVSEQRLIDETANTFLVNIVSRLLSLLLMWRQLIISPVWEQRKLTSERRREEPFKEKREKWDLASPSAPSQLDIIAWEQALKDWESSQRVSLRNNDYSKSGLMNMQLISA